LKNILIVGALSAIAQKSARLWAAEKACFFLAGRDAEALRILAEDLQARGAGKAGAMTLDLADSARHPELLKAAKEYLGEIDLMLVAHGTLPDQKACERDPALAEKELRTNFLSTVSLLTYAAQGFEARGKGTLAVISSVAGDRGRMSNYVYGAAKGGLNIFLGGLRNRLYHAGVRVLTIKPGFVDTPMTAHLKKNPLFASPEKVARDIVRAVDAGKDTIYTPWFWRYVMLAIRCCPEALFKKLRL